MKLWKLKWDFEKKFPYVRKDSQYELLWDYLEKYFVERQPLIQKELKRLVEVYGKRNR